MNRQGQSAGDNATQIQAVGNVTVGVSESRAYEIAEATARSVIADLAEESFHLIQERITKLDDRVIASLIRAGRLEVFADPGFQRSYKKAQSGAAVSDNDEDYDLLAALLTDRAARGAERRIRAGIERSIEIVDQIDSDALRGLTVLQAIQQYSALAPGIDDGLDTLAALFGDLLDGPLPLGVEWMDHLDILDAVRIDQVNSLRAFREYYPSKMPGYLASGAESLEPFWAADSGRQPVKVAGITMEHELKPGFYRLAASQDKTLDHTLPGITPADCQVILEKGKATLGFGVVDPALVEPFLERLRLRPPLRQLEEWWQQIPQFIQVTSVGRVLARANAERLDVRNVLPSID